MKCPACGAENIQGEDTCQSCFESLMSIDGLSACDFKEKSVLENSIRNLTLTAPVFVEKGMTVLSAVERMNKGNAGCAVVVEEGKMIGIITERDVLYRVMAEKKDPRQVQVVEAMTQNPETLGETDSIAYALNVLSIGGYRHVPLMTNGSVVGVVSVRDIMAYLAKILPSTEVE